MLRLRTFGGLSLQREVPNSQPLSGSATQRRPLALLALLAVSGSRGVSRERLLLRLWPESEPERARNVLKQTLYSLRRNLREPDLFVGSVEIALNPDVITSDVAQFEAALDRGQPERAVALYAGPFLDGFYLNDVAEFERWVIDERRRLEQRAVLALQTLADDAGRRNEAEVAIGWWRRLAAIDPTNSRVAARLIASLAVAGDRTAALQHARVHTSALAEELGVPPDQELVALVEEIRAGTGPGLNSARLTTASFTQQPEVGSSLLPNGEMAIPAVALRDSSPRARRRPLVPTAFVLLLLAVGWCVIARRAPSGTYPANVIAVLPFGVRGDARVGYLREGLVDLISARLDGAGDLRAANPRAVMSAAGGSPTFDPKRAATLGMQLGAGRTVVGEIVAIGERQIQITAILQDAEGSSLGRATVTGDPATLGRLIDVLAEQLIARLLQAPAQRFERSAALSGIPIEALRAFLEGERDLRAGRYGIAAENFSKAVAIDTGFALGYYRLSVAQQWVPVADEGRASAIEALRRTGRLSKHDSLLVDAAVNRYNGMLDSAEVQYRTIVSMYPDDLEAWYELGELAFHSGPLRGEPLALARAPLEHVLTFKPNDNETLVHLMRVAAKEGRRGQVDSIAEIVLGRDSTVTPMLRAFRAFAVRDSAGMERSLGELANAGDEALYTVMRHVATYTENLSGASRLGDLLTAPPRGRGYRREAYTILGEVALAQGRLHDAWVMLGPHEGLEPRWGLATRAIYASLPFWRIPNDSVVALRREAIVYPPPPNPEHPVNGTFYGAGAQLQWYALAVLSERLGDKRGALAYANRLDGTQGSHWDAALITSLARTTRALVIGHSGAPRAALAQLDSGRITNAPLGLLGTVLGTQARERFLRASLLRDLGMHRDALRWYSTIAETSPHELVFLAPSHLEQAKIYEQLGDTANATRHYTRFIQLWDRCDPELRPVVDEAKNRVRQLRR